MVQASGGVREAGQDRVTRDVGIHVSVAREKTPPTSRCGGSRPRTGFCERFNRTVKEEFFSVAFRKTLYASIDQLQADLDAYLAFYNRDRAHRGYRTQGRTPYQAFLDGRAALVDGSGEEVNSAA